MDFFFIKTSNYWPLTSGNQEEGIGLSFLQEVHVLQFSWFLYKKNMSISWNLPNSWWKKRPSCRSGITLSFRKWSPYEILYADPRLAMGWWLHQLRDILNESSPHFTMRCTTVMGSSFFYCKKHLAGWYLPWDHLNKKDSSNWWHKI